MSNFYIVKLVSIQSIGCRQTFECETVYGPIEAVIAIVVPPKNGFLIETLLACLTIEMDTLGLHRPRLT